MKMKKILILSIVAVILVAGCVTVCLVPRQTHIDRQLYAWPVSPNGIPISDDPISVELQALQCDYLFRESTLRIEKLELDGLTLNSDADIVPESETELSWSVSIDGQEQSVYVRYVSEYDWAELTVGEQYYCLSDNENLQIPSQGIYSLPMQGAVVHADGTVGETVSVIVAGKLLIYPYGGLRYTIDADFPDGFAIQDFSGGVHIWKDGPYQSDELLIGDNPMTMLFSRFALDLENQQFAMLVPNSTQSYFAASAGSTAPETVLQEFLEDGFH